MKRYNNELYQRCMDLLPPSANRLVSQGIIGFRIMEDGPSDAFTAWDKDHGRFEVVFTDSVQDYSDERLEFLWYHEIGHISLGHFQSVEPCGPEVNGKPTQQADWLIAADISVNGILQRDNPNATRLIKEMEGINAEEWKEALNVSPHQAYSFPVLHDILHQKVEEEAEKQRGEDDGDGTNGSGVQSGSDIGSGQACGGIESTSDPRALISAIGAAKAASADDNERFSFSGIGTEHGGLGISLSDSPLPDWLAPVERFARSIVESELTDGRTHKRPQPTLASAGVRVPSLRPTYKSVPATLCLLVDTSGSMLGDLHYVAPVLAYLGQNGIKVRLIAGDTQVTFDELIERIPEKLEGAGGTDIVPLFDRAMEYDPKAVVAFTDGWVPAWPKDAGVPTLWVGLRGGEAPYGQSVLAS